MNIELIESQTCKVYIKLLTDEDFDVYGGTTKQQFSVSKTDDGEYLVLIPAHTPSSCGGTSYDIFARRHLSNQEWLILSGRIKTQSRKSSVTGAAVSPLEYHVEIPVTENIEDFVEPPVYVGIPGARGEQGERGERGLQGEPGPAGKDGAPGPYYIPTVSNSGLLAWSKTDSSMPSITSRDVRGPKGNTGSKGDPFTYEDFTPEQLAALKGEKGDQGVQGIQGEKGEQGDKGDKGDRGYSPYEIAVQNGYVGDEAAFNSMLGALATLAQNTYDAQILAETSAVNALDYLQQAQVILEEIKQLKG